MKKILVLSDSHGNLNNMILAVQREEPDMVFHLGDGWRDARKLSKRFPGLILEQVPGNCDFQNESAVRVLSVEGILVMLCHGHTFNVKAGYLTLQYAAEEKGVAAALFGHTHRVFYDRHNGVSYLNPGSIGGLGFGAPPSYGILCIDGEKGTVETDVVYIE